MNNLTTKITAIISIVFIFASCSSGENEIAIQESNNELTISAGIPTTRTQYDHETASQLRWSANDSFQLYNETISGKTFSIEEGEGQISAKFSGSNVSNATKAFYPASKASRSGYNEQSLSFVGETQTANNSIEHLSKYTYLLGNISKSTQNVISGVSFKHLTARMKFIITLPDNFSGNVISLVLQTTSNNELFYNKKYINTTNASKDEMACRQTLNLSNIVPDENNELVAYMAIAPTDMYNESIELIIKSNDGSIYTATPDYFPEDIIASNQYTISASFEKSSNTYSSSDYVLSQDGTTFIKWNGEESTLDFSTDTKLNQVTTIAAKAFESNNNIETVILSDNINTIEEYAFYFCSNLSQIVLPANLENFEPAAVFSCPVSYSMCDDNANFTVFEDVLYNKEITTLISNTKRQDIFVVPSTVKTIGVKAFSTPYLKELTIPQTVEEIEAKGLIGCISMKSVLLVKANPSDIKVCENVFYYMPKSTTYMVPIGSKVKYQKTSPWKYQMINIEETEMSSILKLNVVIDDENFDTTTNCFSATSDTQDIELAITSNSQWTVSTDADWLSISQEEGENDATINVSVQSNGKTNRKGIILFSYNEETTSIEVFQAAKSDVTTIQIPIVMHILYDDASDKNQYPNEEHLNTILSNLNKLFNASDYRPDMKIDFVAATTDPQGNTLDESGINRYKVSDSNRSSRTMLTGGYSDFVNYFWEPSKYLNVYIFQFSDNYSGLATLPYMQSGYQMDGVNYSQRKLTVDDFAAPFGLCLNNRYIYNDSFTPTFAHEIGHVLGLSHVFVNDYCDDTPLYDRAAYLERISDYLNGQKTAEETGAYNRYDENGNCFTSRNFMDYYVGYRNGWTNDQFERMQYVIEHAQALPTSSAQQYAGTTTRSSGQKVYPTFID